MKPTSLALALAIAVALSFFDIRWRVELPLQVGEAPPPLPSLAPFHVGEAPLQLHAAGEELIAECVLWAKVPPWVITRCENWEAGEVCLIANSGMIVCKFE